MDAIRTLGEFKKKIDPEIGKYFDRTIRDAEERDKIIADALRYVKKLILAGGKRLRPAFMYYGYLAAGGKEKNEILKTSASIELVHIFLLIHDDVIDKDKKRHGLDTVNARYKKIGEKIFPGVDHNHFGNSMAIIVGDMISALGNQILYEAELDPKLIIQALHKLQSLISMTGIGEAQDVYMEYKKKASEEEILAMYENKTAKYTIEGPLHLGAILGGADKHLLKILTDYSLPIGIAFQIQDDILGVFGNEAKLGKSVGSDIESGKQTLLVVKAREKADRNQKKIFDETLGKKNLTQKEIENFRSVIKETGALDYAKKMSMNLILQGRKAIKKSKIKKESKEFLIGIAEYMVSREL